MERKINAVKILKLLLLKLLMPFPDKSGIIFSANHHLRDTYF